MTGYPNVQNWNNQLMGISRTVNKGKREKDCSRSGDGDPGIKATVWGDDLGRAGRVGGGLNADVVAIALLVVDDRASHGLMIYGRLGRSGWRGSWTEHRRRGLNTGLSDGGEGRGGERGRKRGLYKRDSSE